MRAKYLIMLTLLSSAGMAASPAAISYGAAPAWVGPPPTASAASAPPDAVARVVYADTQVRVIDGGTQTYTAYRIKLLKPEALAAGNVNISWEPSAGGATVHALHIIRDGQVIDVLKTDKFRTLEREQNLEASALDGQLTAALQVPGLQVGDELEVAATVTRRDPTLGDHSFGVGQLPVAGVPGAFRFRLAWPTARGIHTQASKDLPATTPVAGKDDTELVYALQNPAGALPTEGAPLRYNVRRLIEFSDFDSWEDVSRRFWPLFDKAAMLKPNSPILEEARRIAAASSDPKARMEAALALVEDRIRYVYVGLDGGNYRPATADETWERKFGDCKAKTVLLLALLRELKVSAEPILANLTGGDGIKERLPSPALFNHVLIKAQDDKGETFLLDGTRVGDRHLALLPPPIFRWVLPLSVKGENLTSVQQTPWTTPQLIDVVNIDARAGIGKPVKVTEQRILRGDEVQAMRAQLASMSSEDAERAVKSFWRQQSDWIDADKASWRYVEDQATLVLAVEGTGDLTWKGKEDEGRTWEIFGAGFYAPDILRRPKDQDQTAPWITNFPRYRCWATTIRLPKSRDGWHWAYQSPRIAQTIGGAIDFRMAGLSENVMRTVMSSHVVKPELTPAEVAANNAAVPNFDNNMSQLFEASGAQKTDAPLRDIWTLDQLRFRSGDPALLKAMVPDHSLKAVMARLDRAGVKYEQYPQQQVDTAIVDPKILSSVKALPPGEPFVMPQGGWTLVGVVTATRQTREELMPFGDGIDWTGWNTPCNLH